MRTPIAAARANAFRTDWQGYLPPRPSFIGERTFAPFDLTRLVPYFDWSPFFASWELVGRYPGILDDDVVGEAARSLFADAQVMLKTILAERRLEARGVVGLWPANADGDDIVVWTDETRTIERARLHTLRQQIPRPEGRANTALADFIAPIGGPPDWIGGFAVTGGIGELELEGRFKAAGDDYSGILAASLAHRFGEALRRGAAPPGARRTLGLRPWRAVRSRAHADREVPRYPPCARLSGPARPHRDGDPVLAAGCDERDRHRGHRKLLDGPVGLRLRPLFLAS